MSMTTLSELVCTHCGAALNPNTLKCEYCGTQYERRRDEFCNTQIILKYPSHIQKLCGEIAIPDHIMGISAETAAEYSMKELTHRLAEALAPYMKVETMRDPYTRTQIIRGSVRVVDPDFRF